MTQPHSYLQVQDRFYSSAKKMRQHFDERFKDPLKTDAERFIWDYWYVPEQYNLVRTPAYHFFPDPMYKAFHDYLVRWGQQQLGCHGISTPWLSYYVDGCSQELHADVPHGPWAFVFSLTPSIRRFRGGETMILKPQTLSFWRSFQSGQGLEQEHLVERVSPEFNRLVVFDPRFPHGVTPVSGTRDPLEARLVVHGWFVEPRPYVEGALTTAAVAKVLPSWIEAFVGQLRFPEPMGTVSLRIAVQADGAVTNVKVLTQTLVSPDGIWCPSADILKAAKFACKTSRFPKAKGSSQITLPLMFS